MGTIANIAVERDAKITGTKNPDKLALIVRLLSVAPERNTAAQRGKLAAAKRLLGVK